MMFASDTEALSAYNLRDRELKEEFPWLLHKKHIGYYTVERLTPYCVDRIVARYAELSGDYEPLLQAAPPPAPKPCSYCEAPPDSDCAPLCIFRLGDEREAREAADA